MLQNECELGEGGQSKATRKKERKVGKKERITEKERWREERWEESKKNLAHARNGQNTAVINIKWETTSLTSYRRHFVISVRLGRKCAWPTGQVVNFQEGRTQACFRQVSSCIACSDTIAGGSRHFTSSTQKNMCGCDNLRATIFKNCSEEIWRASSPLHMRISCVGLCQQMEVIFLCLIIFYSLHLENRRWEGWWVDAIWWRTH